MTRIIILMISLTIFNVAASKPSFEEYVVGIKKEAVEKGYDPTFIEQVFSDVKFHQRSVKADKNQPEFKMTLDIYLPRALPKWKVDKAIKLRKQHQVLLDKIGAEFGVQPRFIVALWGVESNFGKFQGKYSVISALTTMAYEGRREVMFRRQLFAAIEILKQGHISKDKFLGGWAGAMGQSQFMPESFLHYAYDYNGDGRKDIWQTEADVFASIANYLSSEGWNDDLTWGRQVSLQQPVDEALTGLAKSKMQSLGAWQQQGVRRYDGSDLPVREIKASLIMPDDAQGRIYLVYDNFHTLMKWNRSTYFGASVGHLSDRIKLGL